MTKQSKSRPLTKEEIEIVSEKQKIIKRELSLKKSLKNLQKRKEELKQHCQHPRDMWEWIKNPSSTTGENNDLKQCNLCGKIF